MLLKELFIICCISCFYFLPRTPLPEINRNKLSIVFDTTANLPYIDAPFVSGVIGDSTDPASTNGIAFRITINNELLQASEYSLSVSSSNPEIIEGNKIVIKKDAGKARIFINPVKEGYTYITVTATNKSNSESVIIHYAASAEKQPSEKTYWLTGNSDASAVINQDNNYMIVADDELNHLSIYNRHHSGLPVVVYNYGDKLDFSDGTAPFYKEADVEAGTQSPVIHSRTYWLASMSNGSNFNVKPNRNRLFAIDISGTGKQTVFSFAGYYDQLRESLIKWGDGYGYKFKKSAKEGKNAKAVDGFNAEGAVFAPDNTTFYVAMRAPLVPITNRINAVIAPILNFEAWFNNGHPVNAPVFDKPIELNLGGRGIRDITRLSTGIYIIAAGSCSDETNSVLYKWSGNAMEAPVLLTGFNINGLNVEGISEVEDNKMNPVPGELQVISDNGNTIFYNDDIPAKHLSSNNYKKFRSVYIYDSGYTH